MADGSSEGRADPKQMNDTTFIAADLGHGDTKKCSGAISGDNTVKLSFYTELETSVSCEKSDSIGVAGGAGRSGATGVRGSPRPIPPSTDLHAGTDGRKKRCFDRYDSSESSDSGVAVLSPTESGGCSGSDITEPGSPCSPASSCGAPEDVAAARMPPWSSEPAPAGPRRAAPAPAPATPRRPSNSQLHRRITEYFSHKMKPHNGLKRDSTATIHNEPKKKCSPKNGVSHDLEKYLCYLSQTLSPRVQLDINKQAVEDAAPRPVGPHLPNGVADAAKLGSIGAAKHHAAFKHTNGLLEFGCPRPCTEKSTTAVAFNRLGGFDANKDKNVKSRMNGLIDSNNKHAPVDPSATQVTDNSKQVSDSSNRKISQNSHSGDSVGIKVGSIDDTSPSSKVTFGNKVDFNRFNGVKNTTALLDYKMNGVTCGSNNLNLNHVRSKPIGTKREIQKKSSMTPRRTNRKSSACIANSKNLTWSKANNLKQVQLQKQNCINSMPTSPVKRVSSETNLPSKIPNGVRQLPMTMNSNINNLNVPVTNFQNCHQINIQQPCNGTVTSANLASFVAVPQNVMLTTLRIPQNGIATPTVNQHTNINTYNRSNVNVASPTKINGQFVFPLVQNLNGAVVQIPNLMAKMAPNFVIPQSSQIQTQRQDLQNQQAAQILINGTLLKLTNAVTSNYPNVTKPVVSSNVPMPPMNKNIVPNVSAVGVPLPSKSNFAINVSHPVLLPQPGFIINSVPNIGVKETWSNTSGSASTSTHSTISCSNSTLHHPLTNNIISSQTFHSSSIPIPPVKPPDKSNQILDPSVSMIKEFGNTSDNLKCNIPWLSKTISNNDVAFDSSKTPMRPFAEVCNLTEKLPDFATLQKQVAYKKSEHLETTNLNITLEKTSEELRRVEAVARREETIFTQITVLKDVSSNIHNTVIETTNFTSVTNESSESGMGTDKSIDSPSDSQTSKEGDEDSGLSLSISICSLEVQNSQKSPILKQPKTLRFPPKSASKTENSQRTPRGGDTTPSVTVCHWEECKREFENDTDLLEHLQVMHVESQVGRENYVCLWSGCKVRGKPSCSRLWLERHTLSHGGNKPFKCIVDDCGRRFSTQILLERHVNNHFNEQSPNTGTAKKTTDSAPKLIRRNGKKLRYRRQPWSARMFDFFDAGTMEGLAWRLARSTRWRLGGCCPLKEPAGRHTLTLTAALTATRYNATTARTEALVTYHPPHVLEDEWVPEKEVKRIKRVEIAQLPAHTKVMLYEQFCSSYRAPPPAPVPPPVVVPVARRPLRACAASSSRLLTNLMNKQRRPLERRDECTSSVSLLPSLPPPPPLPPGPQPSGAAKRKLGRRYGGNAFWPCGR